MRDCNAILTFTQIFQTLLTCTDEDIDEFAKSTHASNNNRPQSQRVTIEDTFIIYLKNLHFDLKDRDG